MPRHGVPTERPDLLLSEVIMARGKRTKQKTRDARALREHAEKCDGELVEWDCGCSLFGSGDCQSCRFNSQCKKCLSVFAEDPPPKTVQEHEFVQIRGDNCPISFDDKGKMWKQQRIRAAMVRCTMCGWETREDKQNDKFPRQPDCAIRTIRVIMTE